MASVTDRVEAAVGAESSVETARMMAGYYEEMCIPHEFLVRRGADYEEHRDALREKLLKSIGLSPLPERVDLDVRRTKELDHEWCTVSRVYYQLWPGVYVSGLLYMPKEFRDKPAPAMLSVSGHFPNGPLYEGEQARSLYFAKLGYVTFAPVQNHYEDMSLGASHQTLLVWQNMRAIDFLQSLPEVDDARIGVAGCSGGGYQSAMMLALDARVKVGADVGYTEEYRSILFPHTAHCVCNHIPHIMRYTDQTEVSTLGLPRPIQYMVMNDQTRYFPQSHYPRVQDLYLANGAPGRTDVAYFDTPHNYDRAKRERTYWWMEKWLRGVEHDPFPSEPEELEEKGTFPLRTLQRLSLSFPENKGFSAISKAYAECHFSTPQLASRAAWETYRAGMKESLADLFGEERVIASRHALPVLESEADGAVSVQFPSEAGLMIPATVIYPKGARRDSPLVVMCSGDGREELLEEEGEGSPRALAEAGNVVVVCDPRFSGELNWTRFQDLFKTKEEGEKILDYEHIRYLEFVNDRAWERNSIVWGRALAGMISTDLRRVVGGMLARAPGSELREYAPESVTLVSHGMPDLAVGAMIAAALDERITAVDVDLADACYGKTERFGGWWLAATSDPSLRPEHLSTVPFVLRHGDVLQFAAALADRRVTLRNVPKEAGDPAWLRGVFAMLGRGDDVAVEAAKPLLSRLARVEEEDGGVRFEWQEHRNGTLYVPRTVKFRDGYGLRFDPERSTRLVLDEQPTRDFWNTRGPLTIAMVVQPMDLDASEMSLLSKWITSAGRRSVYFALRKTGRVEWGVSAGGDADERRKIVESEHRLEIGEPATVVATFDPGKRMAIYINGHLSGELTKDVPERVWPSDVPVMLGAREGDRTHADVIMGDVTILPCVMSDAEVAEWSGAQGLTAMPSDGRTPWESAIFAENQDLPPVRALTTGPKSHWFGYYDKWQTDPTDRYVLSMEADFDLRLPTVDDVARIGMIDTEDDNRWIPITETRAWNWQQGCMLQWRPGSDHEIIYNDRKGRTDEFVSVIMDIKTGRKRTLPLPIAHVSPDGKSALCADYGRMRVIRPVVGYAIAHPEEKGQLLPHEETGLWVMDLESGAYELVVSVSEVAAIPYPGQTPGDIQYINHPQWSPDGKRFLFIHRGDNVNSRMMTAARDGSDLRILTYGSSHYDWRDNESILIEMHFGYFLFNDDNSMRREEIILAPAGHHSFLPGAEWFVSDTIPRGDERKQHPFLCHLPTRRVFPLGHFHQPARYSGDVRCDHHPRLTRDGKKVIIDSAHSGTRQMYMIDMSGILSSYTKR